MDPISSRVLLGSAGGGKDQYWFVQTSYTQYSYARKLVLDASGNTYMMQNQGGNSLNYFCGISSFDKNGALRWARSINSASYDLVYGGCALSVDGTKLYAVFGETGRSTYHLYEINSATGTVLKSNMMNGSSRDAGAIIMDSSGYLRIAGFGYAPNATMIIQRVNSTDFTNNYRYGFNPSPTWTKYSSPDPSNGGGHTIALGPSGSMFAWIDDNVQGGNRTPQLVRFNENGTINFWKNYAHSTPSLSGIHYSSIDSAVYLFGVNSSQLMLMKVDATTGATSFATTLPNNNGTPQPIDTAQGPQGDVYTLHVGTPYGASGWTTGESVVLCRFNNSGTMIKRVRIWVDTTSTATTGGSSLDLYLRGGGLEIDSKNNIYMNYTSGYNMKIPGDLSLVGDFPIFGSRYLHIEVLPNSSGTNVVQPTNVSMTNASDTPAYNQTALTLGSTSTSSSYTKLA